jgi:hypothetical protein
MPTSIAQPDASSHRLWSYQDYPDGVEHLAMGRCVERFKLLAIPLSQRN